MHLSSNAPGGLSGDCAIGEYLPPVNCPRVGGLVTFKGIELPPLALGGDLCNVVKNNSTSNPSLPAKNDNVCNLGFYLNGTYPKRVLCMWGLVRVCEGIIPTPVTKPPWGIQ